MSKILRASATAAAFTAVITGGGAWAEGLSGTLRIISDMNNPAPRAVIQQLAADFDAMHPDLTVELEVVDREAWKSRSATHFPQTHRMS